MNGAYTTGEFVAQHLSPISRDKEGISEKRIQPNGVDIGVESVYRISGSGYLTDGEYEKPDRLKLTPHQETKDKQIYDLYSGPHILVYDVEVKIPNGYIGRVYPRSRLMRSGLHLTSALWDQGYKGRGEGLLQIPRSVDYICLDKDMSVAQMVFIEAEDGTGSYDGSHQEERIKA